MSDLFRIVYCSRSSTPDTQPIPVEHILATSRHRNDREGVTGALLCSDRHFTQVLEGTFAAVNGTFDRIRIDGRHEDVVLLHAHPVEDRMFGDWVMALADGADPHTVGPLLRTAMRFPGETAAVEMSHLLQSLVKPDRRTAA